MRRLVCTLGILLLCGTWTAAGAVPAGLPVYFTRDALTLQAEYMPLATGAPEEVLRAVMVRLLAPPASPGLTTQLPAGTKLRRAWIKDGTAYLDFSGHIINYHGGAARELGLLGQIVFTATAVPGVDRAQVLVEGRALIFPEGSPADRPLAPEDLPAVCLSDG